MKSIRPRSLAVGLAVVLLGAAAGAQEAAQPTSLDQLLEQVRRGNVEESAENQRREARFRSAADKQQRLLAEALAAKAAQEKRSEELEATFDRNEAHIPELQQTLHSRQGTLGELFGVVRQVAGDTRALVESSLISAQIPGRAELLGKLAQSREMPSIGDLEQLWFVLQQQMTESGKVVRFPATVIAVGGGQSEQDVVRIGTFNAVSSGRYLQYLPESGKLAELGRQPSGRHLATIRDLESARSGLTGVSIDPSRGSILSLLIQTPDVEERIQQGGLVGYVIIALAAIGLLLAAYRILYLAWVGRKIRVQMREPSASADNPLGRVLKVHERNAAVDVETLELKLDEAILKETPALERGNTMIKVLSVVSPLLGLLGTVTGMIRTFQAITLFGTGDPKLMAGGISEALVTTVLGLVTAIPLVLLHTLVTGQSRGLVQILEEQSAGIVATHAEERMEQQREERAAAV